MDYLFSGFYIREELPQWVLSQWRVNLYCQFLGKRALCFLILLKWIWLTTTQLRLFEYSFHLIEMPTVYFNLLFMCYLMIYLYNMSKTDINIVGRSVRYWCSWMDFYPRRLYRRSNPILSRIWLVRVDLQSWPKNELVLSIKMDRLLYIL